MGVWQLHLHNNPRDSARSCDMCELKNVNSCSTVPSGQSRLNESSKGIEALLINTLLRNGGYQRVM